MHANNILVHNANNARHQANQFKKICKSWYQSSIKVQSVNQQISKQVHDMIGDNFGVAASMSIINEEPNTSEAKITKHVYRNY